jgi:hypothetical protein
MLPAAQLMALPMHISSWVSQFAMQVLQFSSVVLHAMSQLSWHMASRARQS